MIPLVTKNVAGKAKIGIFGGTFNPVHLGHLLAARAAREALGLDEVLFIPCALPALKAARDLLPGTRRLRLLKLALEGQKGFRVDGRELERGGKSYTVDTLRELTEEAGGKAEFTLLLGRDAARDFGRWKEAPALSRLCRIVVLERPAPPGRRSRALSKSFLQTHRMRLLPIPTVDISSTLVRARLARGLPVSWLVPEAVEKALSSRAFK